jgi:RHS repeat-associated protein
VQRASCATSGACSHRFVYDWDEVGKLVRARRWDTATLAVTDPPQYPEVPGAARAADLSYAYSGMARVRKTATDTQGEQRHTLEVFPTLRLNGARWLGSDYERTASTETVYLAGIARVVAPNESLPRVSSAPPHLFFTFGDHLGSTSTVVDGATSEVVEASTYQAFGRPDSNYRPERWQRFRESYRFTGKEDDAEVGLTYFGARYYHAALGRWISADPLSVHGFAGDPNPYAYAMGNVLRLTDPVGLCSPISGADYPCVDPSYGAIGLIGWFLSGAPMGGSSDSGGSGYGRSNAGPSGGPRPAIINPAAAPILFQSIGFSYMSFSAGLLYGFMQGATPGGMIWDVLAPYPIPSGADRNMFQLTKGAGQIGGGIFAGLTAAGLEVGGGGVSLTGIGAFVGVPAMGLGAVFAINGAAGVVVGGANISAAADQMAATGGGGSGGSSASPAPAPKAKEYRERFDDWLRSQGKDPLDKAWDAHHRIPTRYRDNNHPEFREFDFDHPSNIRGVSSNRNGGYNVHDMITKKWDRFHEQHHGKPTRAQIENFAKEIDAQFGHTYWPLK